MNKYRTIICIEKKLIHNTGYFTSRKEPDGLENATHNTFPKLTWLYSVSEFDAGKS
jgi:hypothetical protein